MNYEPLVALGRELIRERYEFVAVTPETHRRANANAERDGRGMATSLRDLFGWNRPFDDAALPPGAASLLRAAGAVDERAGKQYSRVRFATLGGRLFVHGAYPTEGADAVFFGPDTYRFCALVRREMAPARRVVDVGCGSGAGGISAAPNARHVVLGDVNDAALAMARVNAALAGLDAVEVVNSDVLASVEGSFDCVIANPPYLVDAAARTYRNGGGDFGGELSVRITRESLTRLAPGGKLILYTGAAVVDGVDTFKRAVVPYLDDLGVTYTYAELDPDVFGEELESPAYAKADRIAAVALIATARRA